MKKVQKPTIILGGRKEQNHTETINRKSQQSGPAIDLSKLINRPVVIRYIDPRLVPLLAQLGRLSEMVQKYAQKVQSNKCLQDKVELEDLVKSSKDLSAKMTSIMEQQDTGFDKENSDIKEPEKVESELKYVPQEIFSSKSFLSQQNIQDIDMIEVLNKVSIKIDELQSQNQSLKDSLSLEKKENQKLRAELQTLKQKMKSSKQG